MLLAECEVAGVEIFTHFEDSRIEHDDNYVVTCDKGGFVAKSLVIATGGLSIPKMGASDFGYRLARQFALAVRKTRAGLVPFTFTGEMHERAAQQLHHWSVKPAATEGYRTAEVTLGGVDTSELLSKTMECRKQPGPYCIGEVVDVSGHLGGHNFQWAWSSGHAAGEVV